MKRYQLYDTTKEKNIGEPIMKFSAAVFLKREFYEDRDDVIIVELSDSSGSPNDTTETSGNS